MKERSLLPELMDDPSLDAVTLQQALNEVTLVNRILGGNKVTTHGLDYFFEKFPKRQYSIADMGCGDGATLRTVADYCRKKGISVSLWGYDFNPKSIALAREKSTDYPEIQFEVQDILKLDADHFSYDIILSVLTMHHFTNAEIDRFLNQFLQLSRLGVVINDLQRSRLAYVLFKGFSRVFMRSHIARYDGLISIKRAFTKKELVIFTKKLPVTLYQLSWRWAFRYLWILEKQH